MIRLGRGGERRGIEELGLEDDDLARVRRLVASGGLVVVTGPLGSGRATTLRALFHHVRASDKKLVAIEGPGADALEGATQIRVQPRLALTWARAIEAALRLEPDVLLLGSLEDAASAAAAVQAALDGRLVLARVNAQSTAGAIGRWIDLGIAPHALAEALRGVISQRLVRGICPDCREEVAPRAADLERLGHKLEPGERFYAGAGCRECHGTGCRGRTGLFEVLCVEGSARELVRWGVSSAELMEAVLESGLTTLADDGARKLRAGQNVDRRGAAGHGRRGRGEGDPLRPRPAREPLGAPELPRERRLLRARLRPRRRMPARPRRTPAGAGADRRPDRGPERLRAVRRDPRQPPRRGAARDPLLGGLPRRALPGRGAARRRPALPAQALLAPKRS